MATEEDGGPFGIVDQRVKFQFNRVMHGDIMVTAAHVQFNGVMEIYNRGTAAHVQFNGVM